MERYKNFSRQTMIDYLYKGTGYKFSKLNKLDLQKVMCVCQKLRTKENEITILDGDEINGK